MTRLWKSLVPLLAILVLSNCSYVTPPEERPVPNEFGVGKGFFQTVATQTVFVNKNQGTKVTIDTARKLKLLEVAKSDAERGNPNLTSIASENGWEKTTETVLKPKTFLCGWAPIQTAGKWGNYIFTHYNKAGHCNIEFEITETELIGRMVTPSKIDDRSRWAPVITIPITKHYHYEHPKDKYGREQRSKYIENSDRDHWSQRPSMRLNLRGLKIKDWAMDLFWAGHDVDNIEDVEWDYDNNFLGFTVTATHAKYESRMTAQFRFNFLQFEHDPTFERTPYNQRNAKHINVLHILGEKVNGNQYILSAAKWDTRKKHKIYLNNFPKAYRVIGEDAIKEWNDTFDRIGHGRPFEVAYREGAKYAFDLRYPGITWIDDVETSMYAPLGVGMVAADVRNGKVLWGGVTMWGGLLERIVNRSAPTSSAAAELAQGGYPFDGKPTIQLSLAEPEMDFMGPNTSAVPSRLLKVPTRQEARRMIRETFQKKKQQLLYYSDFLAALPNEPMARLAALEDILNEETDLSSYNPILSMLISHPETVSYDDIEGYRKDYAIAESTPDGALNITFADRTIDLNATLTANGSAPVFDQDRFRSDIARKISEINAALDGDTGYVDMLVDDYIDQATAFREDHANTPSRKEIFNFDNFQKMLGFSTLEDSADSLPFATLKDKTNFLDSGLPLTKERAAEYLGKSISGSGSGGAAFDMDRTAHMVAMQYQMGAEEYGVNKIQALRPLIKDLLLHEVGHMIGLGHNFKENILPERGTVPSKYVNHLEDRAKNHNMTNYTTVMGYKNGITDIITDYDDLKPGPMDELVLRYLYNMEYPAIPKDPTKAFAADTDFKFARLNEDGHIHNNLVRITYNECPLDKGSDQCSQNIKEMIVPDERSAHEMMAANNKRIQIQSSEPYKLSYFPQCNDFTASMSYDPFCNRWDRGYDALTLAKNYLDEYKANITRSVYAFTDGKEADYVGWRQYALYANSLRTFGRVRIFYDYMRQKYADDIQHALSQVGEDMKINTFLQFSRACAEDVKRDEIENPALWELMHSDSKESRELKSLCQASKLFVTELNEFLQMTGPDYPFIDRFDRYIAYSMWGGEGRIDWGAAFGKWKELSRMPIKIPALYSLTLPFPYVSFWGWVFPVNQYTSNDGMFLMNTLYPKEYTEALASTVARNVSISNIGQSGRTKIGKSVMSLGFLLMLNYFSNDALDVPKLYTNNLRSQAKYDYSWAIVEVEAGRDKVKEELVRKFDGTIYNWWSRSVTKIPELYMYRKGQTVITPPSGSLILPVSNVRWYSKSGGYYWILKLDYEDDYFDRLKTHSVRKTLESRYYKTMKACIEGKERSGLRYYFNDAISKKQFPGFDFPVLINEHTTARNKFYDSVKTYFDMYEANIGADGTKVLNQKPDPNACTAALRGQEVLVMAASAMNGYMFLGMMDYFEKDIWTLFQYLYRR